MDSHGKQTLGTREDSWKVKFTQRRKWARQESDRAHHCRRVGLLMGTSGSTAIALCVGLPAHQPAALQRNPASDKPLLKPNQWQEAFCNCLTPCFFQLRDPSPRGLQLFSLYLALTLTFIQMRNNSLLTWQSQTPWPGITRITSA